MAAGLSLVPPSSLHGVRLPYLSPLQISGCDIIISIRADNDARRPLPPRLGGSTVKCLLALRERIDRTDIHPGKMEIRHAKQHSKDFCKFILTTPKAEVVSFFREVAEEIEDYCRISNYHVKVRNREGSFRIDVLYGEEKSGPELVLPGECISCFADAPLYPGKEPGLNAGECILEEFSEQPYAICRMDTKGRSGFDIVPVRHVERMSDLNDDEIYALWHVAVTFLTQTNLPFISMVMKQGNHRNLEHFHVRVWVENDLHKQYQLTWSEERQEVWRRLQKLALARPRKQQLCYFFKRDKRCWHGDMCSFLHVEEE